MRQHQKERHSGQSHLPENALAFAAVVGITHSLDDSLPGKRQVDFARVQRVRTGRQGALDGRTQVDEREESGLCPAEEQEPMLFDLDAPRRERVIEVLRGREGERGGPPPMDEEEEHLTKERASCVPAECHDAVRTDDTGFKIAQRQSEYDPCRPASEEGRQATHDVHLNSSKIRIARVPKTE